MDDPTESTPEIDRPLNDDPTLTGPTQLEHEVCDPSLPEFIGTYRILRKLGEGGMGTVFEAEQAQPRRRVAVKVVRGGQFVDEQRIKMFQREADSLARLKHPNIAAIYESGRTKDGQHFFAMELVRGQTLDRYLENRPSVAARDELRFRVRLLRTIANAVHYAHQRGVIHRDLKPTNVILNTDGGSDQLSPEAKILDFGLARITEGDLALATMATEVGLIKGTLQYMSPEQARANPEDIDVRTDVYSLGMMLFEILSQKRPYDVMRTSVAEAVRVICEEPPRSLRSSAGNGHRIDPDLETIVGKALEKEVDRRYSSAAALADDLGRWLRSEPILARPPSTAYQLRKFAARNKALVGGFAATFVVLIAGIFVSTSFGLGEAAQRRRAENASRDLQAVVEFQSGMLSGIDTEAVGIRLILDLQQRVVEAERSRGVSAAELDSVRSSIERLTRYVNATDAAHRLLDEEILAQASRAIDQEFGSQPLVDARLRLSIGDTYQKLGMYKQAEPVVTRAVEVLENAVGRDHPDTLRSIRVLAEIYTYQGRLNTAEPLFLKILDTQLHVLGADHLDTVYTMSSLGTLYFDQGRLEESERYLLKVLESHQRTLGEDAPETANAMNSLAELYRMQGRYGDAEPLHRHSLEIQQRVLGDDAADTLLSMNHFAGLLHDQGRYDEAEPFYLKAVEGQQRTLGDDHPDTLLTINNLAVLCIDQGRLEEAEVLYGEILDTQRNALGEDHHETLGSMANLGVLNRRLGRYDEAERLIREALEAQRRTLGDDHLDTIVTMGNLGDLYVMLGRLNQAAPLLAKAVAAAVSSLPTGHPLTGVTHRKYGSCLTALDRFDEAEHQLLTAFAMLDAALGAQHPQSEMVIRNLIDLYEASGEPASVAEWRTRIPIRAR